MTTSPPNPRGSDPVPVVPAAILLVLVAIGLLWLAGCRTTEPRVIHVPVEVAVPVPVPCPPPPAVEVPPPSDLPIEALTPASSDADVVKAYAATVRLLVTDNIALRLLLRSIQQTDAPDPSP